VTPWQSFWDKFIALVDKSELPKISKLIMYIESPGHENKDLLSEAINSFRLFDILKLWEAVHLPWEAVPER
jgi:hypothetical protein